MNNDVIEKNEFIEILQAISEINVSIKHLENNVGLNRSNFAELLQAKAEHQVEIKHLNTNVDKMLNEIRQIDTRIAKLETLFEERKDQAGSVVLRVNFFEKIKEYWHLLVVFATVFSFSLSFFFGIKVKS